MLKRRTIEEVTCPQKQFRILDVVDVPLGDDSDPLMAQKNEGSPSSRRYHSPDYHSERILTIHSLTFNGAICAPNSVILKVYGLLNMEYLSIGEHLLW